MRRPNHASRFEGIAKTNLQASRASDTETLQSQVNKAGKKRLSLSGLEILHGRLCRRVGTAALDMLLYEAVSVGPGYWHQGLPRRLATLPHPLRVRHSP